MNSPNSEGHLLIVGSGISSTYSLINLAESIDAGSWIKKITVVERFSEFLKGIPYGKRSGQGCLVITSLEDFLAEKELELFEGWLATQNLVELGATKFKDNELYAVWLSEHQDALETGKFRKEYIPRVLYGMFLETRVDEALAKFEAKFGYQIVEFVHAQAINAEYADKRFKVTLKNEAGDVHSLVADKVLLANGATPRRNLELVSSQSDQTNSTCELLDFYTHSFDQSLNGLRSKAETSAHPFNILVVGSNASASELLYAINSTASIKEKAAVTIMSTSGILPTRGNVSEGVDFVPEALVALDAQTDLTAKMLYSAIVADIEAADAAQYDLTQSIGPITQKSMQILNVLSDSEQREYVSFYGHLVGLRQRRIGFEYYNSIGDLKSSNQLTVIAGQFLSVSTDGIVSYKDSATGVDLQHAETFGAVINCIGPELVDQESSCPLVKNLVKSKLISPSRSKRGIAVDDSMRAGENLYVVGPLLADNIVKGERIWHAEHCARLQNYARAAVGEIVKNLT